jgi:hypothetical protein
VPDKITAGDTVKWSKAFSDFKFSDGWVITYYFANASEAFDKEGTVYQTDNHLFTLDSSDTSALTAALFDYEAYAVKGSERSRVDWGTIELLPNFASGNPVDARSHVKKTLDALEATILGKASKDQQEAEIAGRKVKHMTASELLEWRSLYRAEYKSEQDAENVDKGLGSGRRVSTRFI